MAEALPDRLAHEALPCWCDVVYKDRGLTQPDCPRCNFAEDVAAAIRAALDEAARRLAGVDALNKASEEPEENGFLSGLEYARSVILALKDATPAP